MVRLMDRNADLQGQIAGLYRGSLDDFVRRRDALARELRTAGNRDAAARVKSLAKPSRVAWALNLAAARDDLLLRRLDKAVAETLAAQASAGDIRGAVARLREVVRDFADHAADAAERSGVSIDAAGLTSAVLAVLGKPESLDDLRAGRLAQVPEAGGLDFLSLLPAPQPQSTTPQVAPSSREQEARATEEKQETARALAAARSRAKRAQEVLEQAESRLAKARDRVRDAGAEADAAQREHDRARKDADAAAQEVSDLERTAE